MKKSLSGIDVILLDIEGTICPITFVKDTLFPYALQALPQVLSQKWNDQTFIPYRDAFPPEHRSSPATLQTHVEDLTRRDVKIAYLKNLQGYLWQTGYESQAYTTPLFPDVVPHLRQWHASSRDIVIYSSGSVPAQKLLFAHVKTDTATNPDPKTVTSTEDLTGLVRDWFDTVNAGLKTEVGSYRTIARVLGVDVERVLFLSDSIREVGAALEAGMRAVVVDRPGNAPLREEDRASFEVVQSFGEIRLIVRVNNFVSTPAE